MRVCNWLLCLGAFVLAAGSCIAQTPAPAASKQSDLDKQRSEAGRKFLGIGEAPDPVAVERGQRVFVSTCGFCHGASANGGESGPDLIRSVVVLHDENGSEIGPVVHKGRAAKGMPAFPSITDAQISDIAAFLRSKSQGAANRMDYKIQNIVTGNAESGKAFFTGAGGCSGCHSPTGDLAKVATKYEPVALQGRMLYPQEERRLPGMPKQETKSNVTVTVTPKSGAKITGTLEHIDDFNVGLRDAQGVYHGFALDGDDAPKIEIHDPLAAHAALLKKYTDAEMHDVLAYLETLK